MSKARILSNLSAQLTGQGTVPASNIALLDSGVTAGSYGSASQVPIIVVDAKGRVTSASTTPVAGVSSFGYNTTTGILNIGTADGGNYPATITLAPFTTTNLLEGTNKYYTDTRVGDYLTANSYATQTYVNTAVSNLVASAPAALNTLNELAAALGNDASFATTTATNLGLKALKTTTISAGTGLIGGGDLSANRTLSLDNSGVTIGTYNTVTVDAYGRVTSGSNVSYSGGSGGSNSVTTFSRKKYIAQAGDATFLVGYTVIGITSYIQVFINGFLIDETEYTATNGTSITLAQACYAGDVVECFGYTGATPAAAVDTISPFLLMGV